MIGYMPANWATNLIVILMQIICSFIFSLIHLLCSTFMNLGTLEISTGFIDDFMNRIYIIVGIFMLFKFTFSLLTSIVNPDNLTDKEKGFGKIVQRTIISLIMLIIVPFIFGKALEWQEKIAAMVPRLIIGTELADDNSSIGSQLAADAIRPFITPNTECIELKDKGLDIPEPDTEKKSYKYVLEEKLEKQDNLVEILNITANRCDSSGEGKSIYAYEFNGFIAAIVGFIMIFILAGYCVDMAIRFIKLGILQVIAPIPIISYIDPKSEKGGSFGNWIKECTSTYIQLFIKLAIFYFVLEMLGNLSSENVSFFKNPSNIDGFVLLFIILGAFFFMGKAAEFICNILGVKHEKGGFAGKMLGMLAGAGIGVAGAAITGGGLAGMAAGALNGVGSGLSGKPTGAFNKGREIAAQMQGKEKPSSMIQKAQNALMRSQAAKMGITDQTLEDAKAARDLATSRFNVAESLLQQAPDGAMIQWGDQEYSKDDFRTLLYDGKDSLSAQMRKRSSAYDEMKAQGAKLHVGKAVETYAEKYRSKPSDYKPNVGDYKTPANRGIVRPTPSSASTGNTSIPNTSEPSVQEIVNRTANVHDAPTREEHHDRYNDLMDVFNSEASIAQQESIEREIKRNERYGTGNSGNRNGS